METEVLGNIPRLYTALADWLACLLYLYYLPKRTAGWRRYAIHAVFLLLLGVFMQATGQVPQFWFLPCIAVSILIMYLYIRMQTDVPARCAGYYCVRAFILGELAASLEWQLYYYMARRQGTPGAGVRVGILAVVYAAVYGAVFALERNYNDIASPLHVHKKEFLSTLFIGVAVYAASNLSYVSPDTPFSGKMTAEIYNIRTLVDLGGMAILFAHHMQLVEYRRKKERDALQNVLQAQYAQYRSAQDSIDLINKKYHDLKHQIAVLRSETSEEKAHYLDAMEQEIRSYEAQNKTGNEVLDTILTSKSLYCQQHGITLTCVADGAALDFMDTMDLCSLFGNALDNAIKFTPAGGTIRFGVERLGPEVEVSIWNSGQGISPEALPYVFQRFYKEDQSRGLHARGAGLGLNICKVLVNLSGGQIRVESKQGEWCRFVFTLPVQPPNPGGMKRLPDEAGGAPAVEDPASMKPVE